MITSVLSESQVARSNRSPVHTKTGTQIVLATCHSAGGSKLATQQFDVVIIDEATQALEAVSVEQIVKDG